MKDWLIQLLTLEPHFYIGGRENPYMLRWYVLPRNRWLNIYLHKFLRDDDDRALHDHPWWFASIMLAGRYLEHRSETVGAGNCTIQKLTNTERVAPSIAFRRATDRHRVELCKSANGKPIPCWTLVVTGRRVREWGFWCPQGFVPWQKFVDSTAHGNIGRGCE